MAKHYIRTNNQIFATQDGESDSSSEEGLYERATGLIREQQREQHGDAGPCHQPLWVGRGGMMMTMGSDLRQKRDRQGRRRYSIDGTTANDDDDDDDGPLERQHSKAIMMSTADLLIDMAKGNGLVESSSKKTKKEVHALDTHGNGATNAAKGSVKVLGHKWYPRFFELKEYVAKHGRLPSTKQGSLGKWMSDQRRAYKFFMQGIECSHRMTPDRIDALESIPIWVWEAPKTVRMREDREGAANKPPKMESHRWQAPQLRPGSPECDDGKVTPGDEKATVITPQVHPHSIHQSSDDIESILIGRLHTAVDNCDAEWGAKYNELLQYISMHGGLSPKTTHPTLGQWVHRQRKSYERVLQGHTTCAQTRERIRILNSTPGWHWTGAEAYETRWQGRLFELEEYVKEHGEVPCTRMTELGKWVYAQKKGYKAYMDGSQCSNKMTPSRIIALEAVPGWKWRSSE